MTTSAPAARAFLMSARTTAFDSWALPADMVPAAYALAIVS